MRKARKRLVRFMTRKGKRISFKVKRNPIDLNTAATLASLALVADQHPGVRRGIKRLKGG